MASSPLDAFDLSMSADRLSRRDNFKQATVLYSRTLKTNSNFYNEYYLSHKYECLAIILYSQRKYRQAIRKYKKAVHINEFMFRCYDRIGFCLINLGEFEQAIEFFKKALDISADYNEAYINWALALLLQGKDKESVDIFQMVKKYNFDIYTKENVLRDFQAEIKSSNEIIANNDNQDEVKLAQERFEGIELMIKLIRKYY